MPCNCTIDINDYLGNNEPLETIVQKVAILLKNIDEYCCAGITENYSPLVSPEESTTEAFPNGFGSSYCECPIVFVRDSDNFLYYSLDDGVSYKPTGTINSCVIDIDVESDINLQNNTLNMQLNRALGFNCIQIFARDNDGIIYQWQEDKEVGDGITGGEWCYTCNFPIQIDRYYYTGSDQIAIAPYEANTAHVKMWGGGSGSGFSDEPLGGWAGSGAYVEGYISVEEGDEFAIMVGASGKWSSDLCSVDYGFGGIGSGCYTNSANGGGLSGIFEGDGEILDTDASRAILIAGGGGGGGDRSNCSAVIGGSGGAANSGGELTFTGATGSATGGRRQAGGGGGYNGGSQYLVNGNCGSSYGGTSYTDGTANYVPYNIVEDFGGDGEPNSRKPDDDDNDNYGAGGGWEGSQGLGREGHVVIRWYR